MEFRKDLNGLRAIAVISVVLFHFNESWLPGGFAGVDVFFVISGFLMTGIIFKGIDNGSFSILNFYRSRANRIVPALAVLCCAVLVFGWFFLDLVDYKDLGSHVASSVLFFSNILYWRDTGYFATGSHEKWLLHTWSLSAEWQFYIIFPLFLVFMRKFLSMNSLKLLVFLITVLGFIFSAIITYKYPNAAYYLLPVRAWEMLIGGVAYLYPFNIEEKKKKFLEWFGLILIVASYLFISKEIPWPGYLAIFPVLGSFFIIQARCSHSFITGNILFQKLGTWSYSIYLWHWPIVVVLYYFSLNDIYIYIGLVLSVLFGFLSYEYIEKMSYKGINNHVKCKPIYMILAVGLIGASIFIFYSIKHKMIPNIDHYGMANREKGYCFGSPGFGKTDDSFLNCKIGEVKNTSSILLYGDSFAGHFEPLLNIVGKNEGLSIDAITTSSCYPAFSKNFPSHQSQEGFSQCMMNRAYVEEYFDKYNLIFISARLDDVEKNGSTSEIIDMIDKITEKGIIVVFLPNSNIYERNVGKDYISYLLGGQALNEDNFILKQENIERTLIAEAKLAEYSIVNKKFVFISQKKLFLGHTFKLDSKPVPFSADGEHISIFAAKSLYQKFTELEEYKIFKEYF